MVDMLVPSGRGGGETASIKERLSALLDLTGPVLLSGAVVEALALGEPFEAATVPSIPSHCWLSKSGVVEVVVDADPDADAAQLNKALFDVIGFGAELSEVELPEDRAEMVNLDQTLWERMRTLGGDEVFFDKSESHTLTNLAGKESSYWVVKRVEIPGRFPVLDR